MVPTCADVPLFSHLSVAATALCPRAQRLRSLLRIVIPNLRCKEFLILCLHSFFLVSRTMMSIYVAQLDGRIVKSIVDRQLSTFIALLVRWMVVAVPATYINSMIQYLEAKLAIAFRTRLVKHVYEMYMADETYYRIGNLDSRLSNPDQVRREITHEQGDLLDTDRRNCSRRRCCRSPPCG